MINCLNPCCSGRWSRTDSQNGFAHGKRSLNPCCSGRWSRTGEVAEIAVNNSLNPCCSGRWSRTYYD